MHASRENIFKTVYINALDVNQNETFLAPYGLFLVLNYGTWCDKRDQILSPYVEMKHYCILASFESSEPSKISCISIKYVWS